ncbi:hypothetical protein, partial [Bifidobacterium longum]|uniref:hypothetical protein n=1 Tax=Bifidobacterium longum TaxID=216816 RepID=UPI003B9BD596
KYDALYSANSLTAFALNSGVYFVPFAMVPSSPIELAEMRNKKQVISQIRAFICQVSENPMQPPPKQH